jgi:transcriptional regulator NrdR family protein
MSQITVTKRDNSTEIYNPEKIINVVRAAGLTETQSQEVVDHISEWINSEHLKNISSQQIRDRIIQELKVIDPYSANLFSWYEKTKDSS